MSAGDLQSFLRFLTQDAKVPLATAMGKMKDLQKANLDSTDKLVKAKADDLQSIFADEKVAKQVIAAAKRVAKKRAAGDETGPSPRKKKKKNESLFSKEEASAEDLEASLALPSCDDTEEGLAKTVLFTNRAPLALAFVFTLLKYTMPEQPLSSRLSLAQGYIGITSRARAVSLGIESGKSAEEEGFGEGQPSVTVAGQQIRILRRWGYEWKKDAERETEEEHLTHGTLKAENQEEDLKGSAIKTEDAAQAEQQPAIWALDLEALKKSNVNDPVAAATQSRSGGTASLPIYTPQSARAYLMKAFDIAPAADGTEPSSTATKSSAVVKRKEQNLGKLLRALELLYASWSVTLSPEELDKRTWSWYVRVRPDVEHGVAGWGGKNVVKLADILALRREP